ncbi:hypothetical protein OIU85_025430 [Salix viminalis]|uniref:Uncharacterized protein n=1 Tax=Salix viminalis TaxID=40686 RepID=A0A9Q0YXJ2_SALVM|nr:hypothetical protein OIU85_025430 [Salix viminalis]
MNSITLKMMEEFRILLTNWICALQTLTERGKFLKMQLGKKIQALPIAVISHPLTLNPSIHSSMDGQDNTQNDGGIQDLVNKLDMCIANFDGRRQVFENAIGEKIQALEKDRGEARELRLSLHQESGDTRSKKIDDVNQWLNQKALISGAPDYYDFSVLIVDDDRAARDSIPESIDVIWGQKAAYNRCSRGQEWKRSCLSSSRRSFF